MQDWKRIFFIALVAGVLGSLFVGCAGGPVYTIDKGEHSSGAHFAPYLSQDKAEFIGTLTSSCIYELPGSDQHDINKYFGLAYGLAHQDDSFRFGWRSSRDGILEVIPYIHLNGTVFHAQQYSWVVLGGDQQLPDDLGGLRYFKAGDLSSDAGFRTITVLPDYPYKYTIQRTQEYVFFKVYDPREDISFITWVSGTDFKLPVSYIADLPMYGYCLFPWFGGNMTAPHKMIIILRSP